MIEKIFNLFRSYSEAVLGIQNQEIVFFNPAAEELIPNIKYGPADFLPSEVLGKCGSNFVASFDLGNNTIEASGSTIDDLAILRLFPKKCASDENLALLDNVNYQMRDALSVMSMSSSFLSAAIDKLERPDLQNYMSILMQNYYKLARISENLTSFTQMTTSSYNFSPSNIDVVKFLKDLLSTLDVLSEKLSVKISFETTESSHIIGLDGGKFAQMLLNLLSNSIKYTDPGGTIVVSFSTHKDKVIIGVKDTGSGIPLNHLQASITKHSQERKTSDVLGGIGIGLSLASNIARLHGGSLLMESIEGKGTSVKITLPDKTVSSNLVREDISPSLDIDIHQIYTQLADALPSDLFNPKYLD